MIGRLRIKRDGKSLWPNGTVTHPFTLSPSKGRREGIKASTGSAITELETVEPVAAMKRSGIAESLRYAPSIPLRCIEATSTLPDVSPARFSAKASMPLSAA